jgi:hypothetical protein
LGRTISKPDFAAPPRLNGGGPGLLACLRAPYLTEKLDDPKKGKRTFHGPDNVQPSPQIFYDPGF